jgi:septal ring factor EnvC (AmiA/AmiB activator)
MKKILVVIFVFCSIFATSLDEQLKEAQEQLTQVQQNIRVLETELKKNYELQIYFQGRIDAIKYAIEETKKDTIK